MQPLQVGPISIWDEFSEKIWESPSPAHAGMAARAAGQERGCPSPFPLWGSLGDTREGKSPARGGWGMHWGHWDIPGALGSWHMSGRG